MYTREYMQIYTKLANIEAAYVLTTHTFKWKSNERTHTRSLTILTLSDTLQHV